MKRCKGKGKRFEEKKRAQRWAGMTYNDELLFFLFWTFVFSSLIVLIVSGLANTRKNLVREQASWEAKSGLAYLLQLFFHLASCWPDFSTALSVVCLCSFLFSGLVF